MLRDKANYVVLEGLITVLLDERVTIVELLESEGNQEATTPLEEWLDYLKDGNIRDNTTTPGLAEAKERLRYMPKDLPKVLKSDVPKASWPLPRI